MNTVDPIREPEKIKQICSYLKMNNKRDFIMFYTGAYSGLRISDILKLQICDVKNKDVIRIREKKTKKEKKFEINPELKKELKKYCEGKNPNEYLIPSRQGKNTPLSRVRAYQIMKEVGNLFDIPDLGTHTLRKTFGYQHYKQFKDAALLMTIFNHSSQKITLRYIGIEQEDINKSMKKFRLF
ncbi:tyrosine-type recombinase/integrase [Ruminiclostridium papyrosolvens DSM 2782]|uniref:tyrosine-type recombinase/integrase n=1 Tax=Ruminiclostridium papyrosolvens TaxID=29362 RepID=UPI0023E36246|nr:tyrosine-type recombinase/integrase [Ruminiclostridium papyrosolvens]WES34918.1 tyrosine-type recombinase/integrase [Ruminiclostridium papyrosolvens DSM 2782]